MGDALADLFDRWHAEAREDDETTDWAEEGESECRNTKRTNTEVNVSKDISRKNSMEKINLQ